jgi:hypothetical protein
LISIYMMVIGELSGVTFELDKASPRLSL